MPQGPAVPERDLQKMDRVKSDRVFQTLENASAAVGLRLLVTTPAAMCFEFDGNPLRTTLNACVVHP